jgi:hypothetical protein
VVIKVVIYTLIYTILRGYTGIIISYITSNSYIYKASTKSQRGRRAQDGAVCELTVEQWWGRAGRTGR